jgi:hypothetical protein
MNKENSPSKGPNHLISFQCQGSLNEYLRDTAWRERKSLSELIRELCAEGLKERVLARLDARK